MDGLRALNAWDAARAAAELSRCCGSRRWAEAMAARRPFADAAALMAAARQVWSGLARQDWLEAFAHHPKIGDKDSLARKFAATRAWAGGEQSGVDGAQADVLDALAQANQDYERRFGYIFIVCATGKSAPEMLALLRGRLANPPEAELAVAAGEQAKITELRLAKLVAETAKEPS